MFDIKTAVVTFIDSYKATFGVSVTISAISDEEADAKMLSGRAPMTRQAVFILGDCKTEHERFSRGYNRVKITLHMNHYYRYPAASDVYTEETLLDYLQNKMTNDELGQSYAMVPKIYAEPTVKLNENIYRKRFILELTTYEATIP